MPNKALQPTPSRVPFQMLESDSFSSSQPVARTPVVAELDVRPREKMLLINKLSGIFFIPDGI